MLVTDKADPSKAHWKQQAGKHKLKLVHLRAEALKTQCESCRLLLAMAILRCGATGYIHKHTTLTLQTIITTAGKSTQDHSFI